MRLCVANPLFLSATTVLKWRTPWSLAAEPSSKTESSNMQYRRLGNTGVPVSNLTLGTMGFGTETSEDEAFSIIDAFLEAGGNMLDTADVYGGGASEELLGRWRASRPQNLVNSVVLATKAHIFTGKDANDVGTFRRHLHRALDASLLRLGIEAIDLYQMHAWDRLTPIEETLSFLDAAVRAGKVHYVGLSNFSGWQLQLALSTAKAMGMQLPVTLQQQYSLACREIESEVIPAALANNVGLLAWSPLASGFLSGNYTRGVGAEQGTRLGFESAMFGHIENSFFATEQNWATLEAVTQIADEAGATPSQVALSWVTNRPSVTSTILGARTLKQLESNLPAGDLHLGEEATARLNAVSAPTPHDYPHGASGVLQHHRYPDSSESEHREFSTQ